MLAALLLLKFGSILWKRIRNRAKLILFLLLATFPARSHAQHFRLHTELLAGHRSAMYQHILRLPVRDKLSFTNNFLLDNEYTSHTNRIYFFRNMLSYQLAARWQANIAVGLKNPGLFGTLSCTYSKQEADQSLSYTFGFTMQKDLSIEQMLLYKRKLLEFNRSTLQAQLVVMVNLDRQGYLRGFQHLRLGLQHASLEWGLGINLEQFDNAKKTLLNTGVFLKKVLVGAKK